MVFILIVVVSGTIGLFYYLKNKIQHNHLKAITEAHYSDKKKKKNVVENSLSRFERDLFVFERAVKNVKNREELKKLFLDYHRVNKIYDQVRFIDSSGQEVVRIDMRNEQIVINETLQNKSDMSYFTETMKLKSGEVYISPITLNREFGKIEVPYREMLRIAAPIYPHTYFQQLPASIQDGSTPEEIGAGVNNKPMGIVVLNIEPDYFFQILWGYNSQYRGHLWMYSKNAKELIDEDTGKLGHTNFLYCASGIPPKEHQNHIEFLMKENGDREGIRNKDNVFLAVSKVNFLMQEWFIVSESSRDEIMGEPNEIMNDFFKSG
ncbi:MAG: cache domain-containing protein, partial [Nitrospinae bacterium]|nr:cache domain-containing protein [Nitrospinota bacterium]